MRIIDLKCPVCDHITLDHLERDEDKTRPTHCEVAMERVYLPTARGNVIGDECDVWAKNGICNADGTPRHFTSKEAMRKAADKAGQVNYVVHNPPKGSDKSKHTSKWE
jgi:hypothetical protein